MDAAEFRSSVLMHARAKVLLLPAGEGTTDAQFAVLAAKVRRHAAIQMSTPVAVPHLQNK